MFLLLRRYLALAALLFWQGGFTFYASVVVPVGQQVLGSHLEQGFITQQVTGWLNLSGAVALLLVGCELVLGQDSFAWRRRGRGALWLAMVLTLVALHNLHGRLDPYLDAAEHTLENRQAFRPLHRLYLWTSTVQWLAAAAYMGLSLSAWKAEDHAGATENSRVRSARIVVTGVPSMQPESAAAKSGKDVPPVASSASPSHRSRPPGGTMRS
jgi:hypothetical protein